ncbi:rCG33897 [Rattus norvegicus]|uniref:RCG33897 n=1 Tax=Rattus norvegicus TaxID=10116 RepID=A6HCK1_RAT|nr:rCG33897 [Rattus norvegicus]
MVAPDHCSNPPRCANLCFEHL